MAQNVAPPLALESIRNSIDRRARGVGIVQLHVAERDGVGEHGDAAVVDAVVDLLGPVTHMGLADGGARHQRVGGESCVQVFIDDGRFQDRLIFIKERRDNRAGVELAIPLVLMLAAAQAHWPAGPGESLFSKTQPHLLRAARHAVVIENESGFGQ